MRRKKRRPPEVKELRCGCVVKERILTGDWLVIKSACGSHTKGRYLTNKEVEGF